MNTGGTLIVALPVRSRAALERHLLRERDMDPRDAQLMSQILELLDGDERLRVSDDRVLDLYRLLLGCRI